MATSFVDVHQFEKLRFLGKFHEPAESHVQEMSITRFVSEIENLKFTAEVSEMRN